MEAQGGDVAPSADGAATELEARPKSSMMFGAPTPVLDDRTDHLESLMKSVLDVQRRQQERLDVEAQPQDQRWKAMEHQFFQLQRWVRGDEGSTQQVQQSVAELQRLNLTNSYPSSAEEAFLHMPPLDIPTPLPPAGQDLQAGMQSSLNSSGLGMAVTPRLQQGWKAPKMSPFEEDEDIGTLFNHLRETRSS